MKRNKRNEVILFCVAALICGAVIAICISVSMKNNSSESGSSTGEASQTSEMTSGTTSSVTEPVITEPEPIQTMPAESEDTSEPETRPDNPTADMVVTSAASLIGTDFVDGGETPEQGFDNSGFIYYVLRENGYITCPRGVSQAVGDGTGDKLREASQGRSGVLLGERHSRGVRRDLRRRRKDDRMPDARN